MKFFQTILLALMAIGCTPSTLDKCPKLEGKACTCVTYFDGACIVTCAVATQADVDRVAQVPDLCGGHVHFVLVHSKVEGIPASLWKVLLSSKTVDVSIKHSGVRGLVPPGGGDVPEVHTSGEAVIKIDHAKVDEWDWKQLSRFTSEKELTLVIDDTPLEELGPDFSTIAGGQVHKVTLDSTGLKSIRDGQFASFADLSSLSLQNNQLTTVSRGMLAKPAQKLEFLHLNGNLLTSLPDDLFSEMPALRVVYLRDNQIKSLPPNLFDTAPAALQRVDFYNNPWHCDCNLMSVMKSTKTFLYMGKCATPENLAKKQVKSIDLTC